MANKDFSHNLDSFFNSSSGKKLSSKQDELKKAASSPDGEKVKEILNSADINTAIKKGDMDAIKSAVSKALSTDAGKRLAKELSNIMK